MYITYVLEIYTQFSGFHFIHFIHIHFNCDIILAEVIRSLTDKFKSLRGVISWVSQGFIMDISSIRA